MKGRGGRATKRRKERSGKDAILPLKSLTVPTTVPVQLRDGLREGKLHPTHTSMAQNDDTFIFHEERVGATKNKDEKQ
jgi:hypothetical protein